MNKINVLNNFMLDMIHLNCLSSCFDALFCPKTISLFSERALQKRDNREIVLFAGQIEVFTQHRCSPGGSSTVELADPDPS